MRMGIEKNPVGQQGHVAQHLLPHKELAFNIAHQTNRELTCCSVLHSDNSTTLISTHTF